ncbi:hypothetical protein JM79_2727 [Gramella sp. Hel_I_59]|uniref:hypothetical protein n=1 Tax=Gramella sp. Hel_I_59 TaxID=1249978 RepID=UPI0011500173|nr:hypothetical protein [Gramella sp. Hel_I_59]TQI71779.1 hypothetical protein JM79_2727 [Gramella sp. Hel_I_59]
MITKEQTEGLKELIGPKCLLRIYQYFFQHMIVNRDGDPYSQIYISGVLNGRYANPTIEAGIWDYAEHLKKKKEKEDKRKAEILSPVKPAQK